MKDTKEGKSQDSQLKNCKKQNNQQRRQDAEALDSDTIPSDALSTQVSQIPNITAIRQLDGYLQLTQNAISSWSPRLEGLKSLLEREVRQQQIEEQNLQYKNNRLLVFDWLMQLSSELRYNKQTFYMAMQLYDYYQSNYQQITMELLQLFAATSLFMMAKLEEVKYCHHSLYIEAMGEDCPYNEKDLFNMEVSIVQNMHTTIRLTTLWDYLLEMIEIADSFFEQVFKRKILSENIKLQMQIIEILDFVFSDLSHVHFQKQNICLVIVLQVISMHIQKEDLVLLSEVEELSQYSYSPQTLLLIWNELLCTFIFRVTNTQAQDLQETAQYCMQFVNAPLQTQESFQQFSSFSQLNSEDEQNQKSSDNQDQRYNPFLYSYMQNLISNGRGLQKS